MGTESVQMEKQEQESMRESLRRILAMPESQFKELCKTIEKQMPDTDLSEQMQSADLFLEMGTIQF